MPLVVVLALAWTVGLQAPPPGSAVTPSIAPVTIDVVVTDAQGRAVTTLQAGDFSVDEQGTPQPVSSARFVRAVPAASGASFPVQSSEDERREAAEPGIRLFAIFLDEFHVAPGPGADRTRDAIVRFVRDTLSPRDLVVVLKPLDSLLTIRLTRDRAAALAAIETFTARKGDYTARSAFEQKYLASTPDRIDAARAQIASSALLALASHLGSLGPMRKTLIVVSEGFQCAAGRRVDALLPTLQSAVGAANRARVSIYPIHPDGLPPGAPRSSRPGAPMDRVESNPCESFWSLATETSGQAVLTSSQLGAGLQQALADSSGYYELTINPPVLVNDGRFHSLRVSTAKPGLAVRARKGYWTAVPERARSQGATGKGGSPALARVGMARRTSPLIRPWFGMTPAADGTTRVSFVWEPAPRVPGERNPTARPSRVALKVLAADGSEVFQGLVLPAPISVDGATRDRSRATFELPPGRLQVEMSIEDVSAKVLDTDVRDLVVRGFGTTLAFGTPEILRAQTARDYRELADDADAVPAASRVFSRREHLLVRVSLNDPGGRASIAARLGSGLGGSMRDLRVEKGPRSRYQIDLPLAGLAAGAYTIELNASDAAGSVKELLPITVTP